MDSIPEHYVTQFDNGWKHLVQQRRARLKDCVLHDNVRGKEKTYNQIGKSTMRLITTRNGKTVPSNTPLAKRWLRPKAYDEVTHFDEWDDTLLGETVLPTSATTKSHVQAYSRTVDQTIIDAGLGTAYIGETGTTAVDLGSANQVAVDFDGAGGSTNLGLTLRKMIEAKSILGKNEVYEDQDDDGNLIAVVSQQQLDDLLSVTQVTSGDYAAVKALVDGTVNKFMGFSFKRSELLPLVTATDIRSCMFYCKSGIQLGDGRMSSKWAVRDDLNETLQLRTKCWIGATRLEEEKVVEVFCDESP